MHPILFQSRRHHHLHLRRSGRVRRYAGIAVCAPPGCAGGASAAGNLEPGHLHDLRRADRFETLAGSQRLALLRGESRPTFSASRTLQSAGTFYGGVLGAILTIAYVHAVSAAAASARARYCRRRAAAGPRHRAPGLLCRRMLLWQADVASLGCYVHGPTPPRGSPARRCTSRCIRRSFTKRPRNF